MYGKRNGNDYAVNILVTEDTTVSMTVTITAMVNVT